jgi:Fic family protein
MQRSLLLPTSNDLKYFLSESNAIEGVYDDQSLEDSELAWKYLLHNKKLTIYSILKTHKILMQHHMWDAGSFRDVNVRVGNYRAINHQFVPGAMRNWISGINKNLGSANATPIYLDHIAFEKIHPFRDGNGRMGRILYNWERLKNGYKIEVFLYEKRQLYYDSLK